MTEWSYSSKTSAQQGAGLKRKSAHCDTNSEAEHFVWCPTNTISSRNFWLERYSCWTLSIKKEFKKIEREIVLGRAAEIDFHEARFYDSEIRCIWHWTKYSTFEETMCESHRFWWFLRRRPWLLPWEGWILLVCSQKVWFLYVRRKCLSKFSSHVAFFMILIQIPVWDNITATIHFLSYAC